MKKGNFLFTSESVTPGHVDKMADQISDAIVDAVLEKDPHGRVAIETLIKTGFVMCAGELTTKTYVDFQKVIRETVNEIGYNNSEVGFDGNTCAVLLSISEQSPNISQGVTEGEGLHKEQGAGDQGLMFGYACNETPELMPMPITFAHHLTKRLADARKSNEIKWLRPDGKSQVTIEYENGKPKRVDTVVVSTHHAPGVSHEEIKKTVIEKIINPVCGKWMDEKTKIYVNPTGSFEIGGPVADAGVTGRKIIVDTYGGYAPHGGGAFCLAGDSLVNTEKGLVQIDACKEVGENSLLVKTDIHPMPAGDWYDNGVKQTEVIQTLDGYTLEATPNHNLRVIDTTGNYIWKPVEKIESTDWLAIQTKNRFFGNDKIPAFKYTYKEGTAEGRKKKYNFPEKLTEDYAYLLGLSIGDGDCTDEGCLKICVCEDEMKTIVQDLFSKLFSNKGNVYGHWAYIGGVELRAYLKNLGLGYAKSYEKIVPTTIFGASKNSCAAFLRGLFDTDGSIRVDGRNKNTKRIHLATTSKKLAEQTQLLLLNFGIISVIQPVKVGKKPVYIKGRQINSKHDRYDLTIKGSKSIESFLENIGFGLPRKQKILESISIKKTDRLTVPNQRNRIIALYKKLSVEEQKQDACGIRRFTRSSNHNKATKELTYEKLSKFIESYEKFLKNEPEFITLQELYHMGHYYSKLQNKLPSFSHTYDLNIPFSHTYTANGFVCHNSGKDPTKVDRSAAYMARYVAKNVVAAKLAEACEVQLAYAIGVAEPVSVYVNTFGTGKVSEEQLSNAIRKVFPLTPKGIIDTLQLRRPIYKKTAAYGHFGRNDPAFTWEKTDKVHALQEALAVAAKTQ